MRNTALAVCFVASVCWAIYERSQGLPITDQVVFAGLAMLFIILD